MRHICQICGYVYDDDESVPFHELPDDWRCPLCKAPKSQFEPELPAVHSDEPHSYVNVETLTLEQKIALCANLERACEKQYREEEAKLFGALASYLGTLRKDDPTVSLTDLKDTLQADLTAYPALHVLAQSHHDRGADRALVWGEKVTRMMSALVGQYLQEGEEMLRDQKVYVCTACGFIAIGEAPPEQCPVCRVPAWKFELIEGRA